MQTQWTEKYRPATWDDVVGHESQVRMLRNMASRGALGGNAFWISGKPGNGKTSLAYLIARSFNADFTLELNATEITEASARNLAETYYHGFFKTAFIVNEAHGLAAKTRRGLLSLIEPPTLQSNCLWVFTTTLEGAMIFDDLVDAQAFLSRCKEIKLAQRGVSGAYVERCKAILAAEGLPDTLIPSKLAQDNANNLRAMIQQIEQLSYCYA